jgi:alkylhydroperoxidase family enzyme
MADASPRLKPLPHDSSPELKAGFEAARERLGFIPNSQLILQRRPHIIKAFRMLTQAVSGEQSGLDAKTRSLVTYACCTVTREPYVWAHAADTMLHTGQEQKIAAFDEYRTNALFTDKERVTIEFARAASGIPNGVTDELLARVRRHWSEEEIVDLAALIALYGFFDRYNGTLSTPLEDIPRQTGEKHLAKFGWAPGRHAES